MSVSTATKPIDTTTRLLNADPIPARTIPEVVWESAARRGEAPAMWRRLEGEYQAISYRELTERVQALAAGLAALGVNPGDRLALLSENRLEWALTDLATLCLGGTTVGMFATLPAGQVEYIVRDSGARLLVVSERKQLAKALAIRDRLPELQTIVVFDPPADTPLPEGVLSLAQLIERGTTAGFSPDAFAARRQAVRPEDTAAIIYTSGTTGEPKGAVLTHANFVSNALAAMRRIHVSDSDRFLSFLPLPHVFERLVGYYLPLVAGGEIAYAGSLFTLIDDMAGARPTVMACVPRLYESIASRITEAGAKLPPRRRRLFDWAVRVGREANLRRIQHRPVGPLLALQYALADRLVLSKARERTGGNIRYFVSGGAPLMRETAEYFAALGLTILEGYGLTETSPVITFNPPEQIRLGTVGTAIDGVEVRLAPDGEILCRGHNVMQGYYKDPVATQAVIDSEGWFQTGDVGVMDAEGYLSITDRKKEILVLSNGKNVAPAPIEARLKTSPFIAQAVLLGDRQNVVSALIVPDFERLRAWARETGIDTDDDKQLIADSRVRRHIKKEIDRLSTELADFQKVKRFALLDHDFSADSGELTPTLKLKRRVIAEKYAGIIAGMGGGGEDGGGSQESVVRSQ
jgi:long-chain acyl-CoA synthetase